MKPLRANELVVVVDRKGRKHLMPLVPGDRIYLNEGHVACDSLIGTAPGRHVKTSKGDTIAIWRPTLEEYILLMPRAAQVVPPKDVAFIVMWADVFPGATVVEAGLGSGALTLGLLRAVGTEGKVIAFELRESFANRGKKNVEAWPENLGSHLEVRLEDVNQALATMQDVDRVVLDLPEPWDTVAAAAQALVPAGLLLSYLPTIRQVDRLAIALLDHPAFDGPEVAEVLLRPWVADRTRLRPVLNMSSHSGFLVRARRRAPRTEP